MMGCMMAILRSTRLAEFPMDTGIHSPSDIRDRLEVNNR